MLTRVLFFSLAARPLATMTDKEPKKGDAAKKSEEADAAAVAATPAPAVEGDDLFEEFELPGGERMRKKMGTHWASGLPTPLQRGRMRAPGRAVSACVHAARGGGGARRAKRETLERARTRGLFFPGEHTDHALSSLSSTHPFQARPRTRPRPPPTTPTCPCGRRSGRTRTRATSWRG